MQTYSRWDIAPDHPDGVSLAASLKVPRLIARLLINRGQSDPDACRRFLQPNIRDLYPPELMPGALRAAERLAHAVREKQRVVVYGDYDADGICATSILWHAITSLGGVCEYYIPHRQEEGYGLNAAALTEICNTQPGLIVSVDCGITAVEPARVCADAGVDLIITDHHDHHPDALPEAYALVHPALSDQPYPNRGICGAGVALKLAWALGQKISGHGRVPEPMQPVLISGAVLAALATVTDIVPLTDENRILVAFGLKHIDDAGVEGLSALKEAAGIAGDAVNTYDVGFKLGPRLNAAGRVGHAALAVELLTAAKGERAKEIARELCEQNRQRQKIEKQIETEAIEMAKARGDGDASVHAVVVAKQGWHAGVIGIVASKVVRQFNRPAVVVSLDGDTGQGSCRSIEGFHLARGLAACGGHLIQSGGHEMAAGLKLRADEFEAFRAAFQAYAKQTISDDMLVRALRIDAEIELADAVVGLAEMICRLGPFGRGNPEPVFLIQGVELVASPSAVGSGQHLKLVLGGTGKAIDGIYFQAGHLVTELRRGDRIDVAAKLSINRWNNLSKAQLTIADMRKSA